MDQTLVHFIYKTGTILEIPPDVANQLSPSQAATFVHGAKCELAAWYSELSYISATHRKLVIDRVYSNRIFYGLWQARLVKWLAIACTVTYIAVFLTITFGCWPYAPTV
ncbi:hypothetical protein PENARI_c025G01736 [Penicillium arizonense]|uniref:Uncharacterized protein n=1 Tax=Penicillium arizonense TaxID=1835702 RepID=A0A1F5L6R1_PENAI|nr:hypothetical protein PENARI_c025G01736 [Penicillium arizonense]OGE48928.1 hypothetical protein PENARI_c025G01736 [Penicillium arizonense]